MSPQEFSQFISQTVPGVRKQYVGGSDGDQGNEQWIDHSGFGGDRRAAQMEDLYTQLSSMRSNVGNGLPGMNLTDARMGEIIRGAGTGNFSDFSQIGQYLNPEENSQFNSWKSWVDQENASMDMFTYMPLIGGAMLGAGAGGLLGGAGAAPAAAGGAAAEAGAGASWLTGGMASGAGIGGVGSAGLGLTAPAAGGIGSLGGGLGLTTAAGGAATVGGASGLGSFVSSLLQGTGIGAGDLVKGGLNFLINQNQAKSLEQAGQAAAAGSNPLNAPQRQQYQQQLQQLLQNPETFYSTNPVVKAQLDMARQQFEANSAKMGVGGTQFNNYLKNVQNIASGTFNDQAELLSGLGGFGFPGGNNAQASYQGAQDASKFADQSFRGLGNIMDKIYGGLNKMGQASNGLS